MDCAHIREALSARMDGEVAGIPHAQLDAHLTGCPDCAAWLGHAERVTRSVRLQLVQVPDLTAPVLTAVAADPQAARRQRHGRAAVLRLAVAVAAIVQLVLAVPVLIGADLHVSREMASFEMALAVGFGLAAWRPQWARAFVPVAVVLAAALAATSTVDIVAAQTTVWLETGHLAAAVQAVLLWALARQVPPGPAGAVGSWTRLWRRRQPLRA